MRILTMAVVSAAALGAAGPAAAQMHAPAPGQFQYQSAPIPAPGGGIYAQPPRVSVNAPQPRLSYNVPRDDGARRMDDRRRMDGQQGHRGPDMPNAGPRVWQNGRWVAMPPSHNVTRPNNPNRWNRDRDGRWSGGSRAPGGWGAYRRLGRGHHMPDYWLRGGFGIADYLNFGLAAPPRGYHWVRYYDDAVLVDDRGDVWDSVGGIGWDGGAYAGNGYSESYSYSSSNGGYDQPIRPVDPNPYYGQQQYYEQQYQGGYAPPVAVAPPMVVAPPPAVMAPPPAQYGYGAGYGSSYQAGSYYYGAPTSTTVMVIPTTTTTTVVEETIETVATRSYVRAAPKVRARRVVRRAPVKRYRAKPTCCVCICR